MSDIPLQPHTTYNRITASITKDFVGRRLVYRIVLRKWHDQTGVERYEKSSAWFKSQAEATAYANRIADEYRRRLAAEQ